MTEPVTLDLLTDDAVFSSFEHQLHLADVLGEHSWSVDLEEGVLDFTGATPRRTTALHLLGSAAPGPRSWLWSWANPGPFSDEVTGLAAVQAFGEQHGIDVLADAEVPLDVLPFDDPAPIHAVGLLTDAAKALFGRWTSYNGDAGGGTRVAFLVEHPDFVLPPPEPARVLRVLVEGTQTLRLVDHRRAVDAYARRRPLSVQWTPDRLEAQLAAPGLGVTVSFDQHGRIADINGALRPW